MFTYQVLLAQPSLNPTRTLEISSLLDYLLIVLRNKSTEQFLSWLGILLAAFAVGLWCLKSYKNFQETGLRPKANELIVPFILVLMLFNNGKNMKELVLTTKNTMHNFNVPLHKVVNQEVGSQASTDRLINSVSDFT